MYVNKRPQSSGQNGTASNLQSSISVEGRLHTRFARQCYKPEHRILHRLPPPKQTSFFSPGRWAALETDAYFAHSYCSQAHTRLMASTTTPIIYFPHLQHLQEFKSVTSYIFRKAPIYTSDNPLQIQLTHISEKHQDPTRNLSSLFTHPHSRINSGAEPRIWRQNPPSKEQFLVWPLEKIT